MVDDAEVVDGGEAGDEVADDAARGADGVVGAGEPLESASSPRPAPVEAAGASLLVMLLPAYHLVENILILIISGILYLLRISFSMLENKSHNS